MTPMDSKNGLRMLIADDDPCMRNVLRLALGSLRVSTPGGERGFMADTAGTVAEAREKFRQTPYDIALLDGRLPDGKGHELAREIRAGHPRVYIVLMTAGGLTEAGFEFDPGDRFDILIKPFDPDMFRNMLAKAAKAVTADRAS